MAGPRRPNRAAPGKGAEALQQAQALAQRGRFRDASRACEALLKGKPAPALEHQARRLLGACLLRDGLYGQAAAQLEKATRGAPNDVALQCELAQALQFDAQTEASERVISGVLARRPDHPEAIARLASLMQATGRHDEAVELIDGARARGIDHPSLVIALAGSARRVGREDEVIGALRDIEQCPGVPVGQRQEAAFQGAALLDKLGRHDEAFDRFEGAHTLVPSTYDPRSSARDTDEIINAWTPGAIASAPRGRDLSEAPIFIVGMPRSGTTLVENILGAHPEVHPAGELMTIVGLSRELIASQGKPLAQAIAAFGEREVASGAQAYLSQLKRLAPKAKRVVDKQPFNFLSLGLIAKLFPGARVIHTRRDPRDTCLSCYFRNFANAAPWATDQRWLGSFYGEYLKLMRHWRETLTGDPVNLRFMEIGYEDVIADQEGASRTLIEFAGLDWDERVMRFFEKPRHAPTLNADEVGRPVYGSSVGKWRAYEHRIGPLLGALEACGAVPGPGSA